MSTIEQQQAASSAEQDLPDIALLPFGAMMVLVLLGILCMCFVDVRIGAAFCLAGIAIMRRVFFPRER
jgi:hypothetical protein